MIGIAEPAKSGLRYAQRKNQRKRTKAKYEYWETYESQKAMIAKRKEEVKNMSPARLNREIARRYDYNVKYLGMEPLRASHEALSTLKSLGADV